MPSKAKAPKIKVEEVEDVVEAPKKTVETPEVAEVETKKTESVPKVTSFSQLDSSNVSGEETPAPAASYTESNPTEQSNDMDAKSSESSESVSDESSNETSTDVKEWLKDIRPDTTKDVEKGSGGFNGKLFFGLLIVFILLGALAGGLFYYKQRVSPSGTMKDQTIEPTVGPTTTPTPAEVVDLTGYSVNVLNGSGTAGQAGVVEDLLVEAGFTDDNVSTGNASTYDFENTEVRVKTDVSAPVIESIIKALEGSYTVEIMEDTLAANSSYDIVITVGQEK